MVEKHQIVTLGLRRLYEGDGQKIVLSNPEPELLINPEDELYVLYPANTSDTRTAPKAAAEPCEAPVPTRAEHDAASPGEQF